MQSNRIRFARSPLVVAIACAGLMGTAQAGEVLDFDLTTGDGFILVDEEEGILEPGVTVITGDLNNPSQFVNPDTNESTAANCIIATTGAECDGPPRTSKRVKYRLTGMGALDSVFTTANSGGTTEYFNFSKVTNETGARMLGYQVQIGTGTGSDFVPASSSDIAGDLYFDLGEDTEARTGASVPCGLFGAGCAGNEDEVGYFDTDGEKDNWTLLTTEEVSDILEFGNLELNATDYARIVGAGLLSTNQLPEGLFIDDGDPTTEDELLYWNTGFEWRDENNEKVDQDIIDEALARSDTYQAEIEDLANSNVNYSFDIADINGTKMTIRFVPRFAPIVEEAGSDYQFAVAGSLDSSQIAYLPDEVRDGYGEIIDAVMALDSTAERQQALERAGTSYLRNFGTQGMLIGRDKMEGILQHLDAVRDPALGVTQVTGTQANISGQADYAMMAATDSAADVAMALDENGDATFAASERSTVFISGSASTGDLDSTENGAGADYNGYSLTAGADYSFTDELRAGAAVAYGENDADVVDGRGTLEVDGTSLMAFGSYGGATGLYGDAVLGYSWLDYDNERNIVIGDSINERAESSTDGEQMSLALRSGYNVVLGPVVAGPSARYQYLDLEVDGYEESGAGVLSMSVDDMNFESSTLWLGGEVSMPMVRDDSFLRPTAHVHWVKEFEDDGTSVDTRFTGGAVPFVTPIDGRDSDYIRAGIGFDGSFETGGMPTTVSLKYDGTFDNDDYEDHRATLGVDVRF